MTIPYQLTSKQLLAILHESGAKISHQTLWRLSTTEHRYARCVIRRTKHSTTWSLQKLQDAGILPRTEAEPALPIAGPMASFSVRGLA